MERGGGGDCDSCIYVCASCVCVCVRLGKDSEGGMRGRERGREGGSAWQMETAGPNERPSIVWPTSTSL